MKNIAIFVSGEGKAAERIVKLFNEGNRVKTVLVVMDDSARGLEERLKGEDVTLLYIPDEEWHSKEAEVAAVLRAKDVRLSVLDNFALSLSDEIMEATDGEILRVSSPEMAPREVVNALEADLRKPVEPEKPEEETKEETPSLEKEWADALKIQYTPPKIPTTPPQLPQENQEIQEEIREEIREERREENPEPWKQNRYYYPHREREREEDRPTEPMPSTWLIWSVLVTVFCCFIPGIIAIIFSSQVSSRYYAGDVEGAKRSSRMAEIWIIVSFVLGVLTATLYLPFMLMGW